VIDVIICTYNRCEDLKDVLESLHHQDGAESIDYEITVVDNNSSDATKNVVEEFRKTFNKNVRYIFEKKQGQAAARNRGIKESSGDIIAFIDDDAIASERWLNVVHQMFSSSDIDCLTGRIIPIWNSEKPKWYHEQMHGVIGDINHGNTTYILNDDMAGGNMAIKMTIFKKYGGFKVDLGEDSEFSSRILKYGCGIIYCPDMLIYHKVLPHRLTKRYFRRWFFSRGIVSYIIDRDYDANAPTLFRIPLWMYRRFIGYIAGWLKCLVIHGTSQRFMYETLLCHFFGYAKSAWSSDVRLSSK
jgi:glycosyltransferase involved in cell wall biosynthesis